MHKILIIGGGGREHALAWKLSQSPKVEKIFIAPGNAGTATLGENVNIPITDIGGLVQFAIKEKVDLTVVGPDDALALGIVDIFKSKNLKIWGPTKAAAKVEWSKSFAKEIMTSADIPTAHYKTFTNYNDALAYCKPQYLPIVIKASGLALGKGVNICKTMEECEEFLRSLMVDKIYGEAGVEVVIEELLQGQEFSVHAFSDGHTFKLFPPSQDHKRIFDSDQGPNTGGMGTIAPLPWVGFGEMQKIANLIVSPALEELKKLDSPFTGVLYPGVMTTKQGPKVIEFNSRFGDPETQSYMRLLKTDLFEILNASAEGHLGSIEIEWENKFACCIILASGGYPGPYEKGKEIFGIEKAEQLSDVIVFHSGTKLESKGDPLAAKKPPLPNERLVSNGGRVLGVTATGDDLKSAIDRAYQAVSLINFDGMYFRKDIGRKSLNS